MGRTAGTDPILLTSCRRLNAILSSTCWSAAIECLRLRGEQPSLRVENQDALTVSEQCNFDGPAEKV